MRQKILLLFSSSAILQLAMFFLFIAMARLLSLEDYGVWRFLFLIQAVLMAVSFSAIPISLLYFLGKYPADVKGVIKSHLVVVFGSGSFVGICIYLFSEMIASSFNMLGGGEALRVFAPAPLLSMLITIFYSVSTFLNLRREQLLLSLFSFFLITIPVLTVALLGAGLKAVLIAYIVSNSFVVVFTLMVTYKRLKNTQSSNRLNFLSILVYSSPLLGAAFITVLGLKVDQIILNKIMGLSQYALYSAAAVEIPVFALVLTSISTVMMPNMVKAVTLKKWEEVKLLWERTAYYSALILFPLSAFLVIEAESVMLLLFGERFLGVSSVFAILSILGFLRITTYGIVVRSMGKTTLELIGAIGFLILSALFVLLLSSYFGLEGAAFSIILSTGLMACYFTFVTLKITGNNINLLKIYPFRLLLKIICIVLTVKVFKVVLGIVIGWGSIFFTVIVISIFWLALNYDEVEGVKGILKKAVK